MSENAIDIAKNIIEKNQKLYSTLQTKLSKAPGVSKMPTAATGLYAENLVVDLLSNIVGDKYKIYTGIITKDGYYSAQIDIIIARYDANYIIKQGNFVVIDIENVIAAIEVKSMESIEDYLQLNKTKSFFKELNFWIIYISTYNGIRNPEKRVNDFIENHKNIDVKTAVIASRMSPKFKERNPDIINDPYPSEMKYLLNPCGTFQNFIDEFSKLKS
jgi:hypothetical protein